MKQRYTVIVKPGSGKNSVEQGENTITVRTTRPAHGGEANKSVIEQLADHFNVSKSSIRIILGSTAKEKLIEVSTKE